MLDFEGCGLVGLLKGGGGGAVEKAQERARRLVLGHCRCVVQAHNRRNRARMLDFEGCGGVVGGPGEEPLPPKSSVNARFRVVGVGVWWWPAEAHNPRNRARFQGLWGCWRQNRLPRGGGGTTDKGGGFVIFIASGGDGFSVVEELVYKIYVKY